MNDDAIPAEDAMDTDEAEDTELQLLQQENERLKELAARAQADLQNAKQRLEREAGDSRRYASEGLLRTLLPTIDNLQRAFIHLPEELASNEWVKGVQAVEKAFMQDIQAAGLQPIIPLGETVDPNKHEVLQMAPGDEGVILEVYEAGYMLHDKVLRPAKVKVGDGTAS